MTDNASSPAPPTDWPVLPQEGMIDRILDILAKEGGVDREKLVPSAKMADLDIASFDMVMILMELEEAFNAYVPMGEELADTVYLHDLIKVLAAQMQPKDGGLPTLPTLPTPPAATKP